DCTAITRATGWRPRPLADHLDAADRALLLRLRVERLLGARLPRVRPRLRSLAERVRKRLVLPTLGTATLAVDARAELGEGPLWHAAEGCLYWVDIPGRVLHRYDPAVGRDDTMHFDQSVSAVFAGPHDEVLVALEGSLAWVDFARGLVRPWRA